MLTKKDLRKITDYLWEIPKNYRSDMRVPARVYTTEKMLDEILHDRSLTQLANVATLPGIQKYALAMPDIHEGYGFPIGGVAVMKYQGGVISPGGIGYDINCGVRLLVSSLSYEGIKPYFERLADELYREIPAGVGKGGRLKLDKKILDNVLKGGAGYLIKDGYAEAYDVRHIESGGVLLNADPSLVSNHAKERGQDQLGTMGAGNHFVEVDRVDQIFDSELAKNFGLQQDQIVVQIHTGSRGLGHQVATDYIREMIKAMPKYNIQLPDRELACVPLSSHEGQNYFNAMGAAANFAWANRQMITQETREVFKKIFGGDGKLKILYDVAHNIAKIEEHIIDDKKEEVIVHRKGATRAFGPGSLELPDEYRLAGQPVIIPGSMGSASYVLVGTKQAGFASFGSSCHGAGRRLSRHAAKEQIQGKQLLKELTKEGIHIRVGSVSGLAEEAPLAYKDVNAVVDVVEKAQIAKKVALLKPVVVIKG